MQSQSQLSSPLVQGNSHSGFRQDDMCEVQQLVGQDAETMSDSEREAAAYRAGVAMQAWYSQYQQTGDTKCLDIAYHHLNQMRAILAGRSQKAIRRMEQERGLV